MALSKIMEFFTSRSQREAGDPATFIGNRRFGDQLSQVQKLKRFFFEEKVRFNPEQLATIDLGPLNNLHYRESSRQPTDEEWRLLDEKLSVLASYLNDDLRRKIRIRELGLFFGSMPLIFLSFAVVSTIFYTLYPSFFDEKSLAFRVAFIVAVVAWTISQGGLGACAFLGTRVAIQDAQGVTPTEPLKESADVTDINVLRIRIILGCLFAFFIGLPLAYFGLEALYTALFESDKKSVQVADFAFIFVPFLLGFSTNLVLVILDRFVSSIHAFFGIKQTK